MDWVISTASDFIEFIVGRSLGKLLFWGLLAFPVLALVGYFGVLGAGRRSKPREDGS